MARHSSGPTPAGSPEVSAMRGSFALRACIPRRLRRAAGAATTRSLRPICSRGSPRSPAGDRGDPREQIGRRDRVVAAPAARRSLRGIQALSAKLPRIALTSGEPAGVGPELCLAIARRELLCELVCLADRNLLVERARHVGLGVEVRAHGASAGRHEPGALAVEHHPLGVPSIAGRLDAGNARYVLGLVDRAIDGALAGEFDAVVTAPVHKGVINDAGIPFSGHTEYLAQRTHAARAVMMLASGALRVALATTHLPLKAVSAAITVESLCQIAEIVQRDLTKRWRIRNPRIAVCGLNPHAGEGGYLGDEEVRVIAPAIARMRQVDIRASGPLPADIAFVPR